MTKKEYKNLLRIARAFIKLNYFMKVKSLPQSAISRFINYDEYNDMVGDRSLGILCDSIYSSCKDYVDLYENYKKIA